MATHFDTIKRILPASNKQIAEALGTHSGDVARMMNDYIRAGKVTTSSKGRGYPAIYSLKE